MTEPVKLTDSKRAVLIHSGSVVSHSPAWTLDETDVSDEVRELIEAGHLEVEDVKYVRLTDAGRDALWADSPGHTPAPWRIEEHREGVSIVGQGGNTIAVVLDEDPVPRQEANARLIVSSPDMLAKLQQAHAQLIRAQVAIGALAGEIAALIALATGSNG